MNTRDIVCGTLSVAILMAPMIYSGARGGASSSVGCVSVPKVDVVIAYAFCIPLSLLPLMFINSK